MDFSQYFGAFIIVVCLVSSASAQIVKLILSSIIEKKFLIKTLFNTGGMPSSHTAFVSTLAVLLGFHEGFASIPFAIATCFALIVMHDAVSVRRSVGIQAKSLNNLTEVFTEVVDEMSDIFSDKVSEQVKLKKIKELLGHSPLEVFIGCLHGIVIGYISYQIFIV